MIPLPEMGTASEEKSLGTRSCNRLCHPQRSDRNRIVRQARTFPDDVSILKIITDDLAGRIAIPGIRSGCSGDYLSCSFMLNDCRRCPTVPGVSVFHPNGFSIFCIQNLDGRLSAIVPKNNQFVLMQNGVNTLPRLAPILTSPKLRSQSFLPSKS